MRLQLILPRVEPTVITLPSVCPHDDCEGTHFQHHQEVSKTVRDTATFDEPKRYPEGIDYVLVNGALVVDKGKHTGVLNGRILSR